MPECAPFNSRSFISSKGRTSATISTPCSSHRGRPSGKFSSTTHCMKGSAFTGQASCRPSAADIRSRSASVVAGTMRSTMVEGKATSRSMWSARCRSLASANWRTSRRTVSPLDGRLSQHSTVKGGVPVSRRRSSAAAMKPCTVRGRAGSARSAATSGCERSSLPSVLRRYAFSLTVSVTIRIEGSAMRATSAAGSSGATSRRSSEPMTRSRSPASSCVATV